MLGFVFAAVMNFGSYWFSDKIVLTMYGAKEVGPDHPLYRIIASLAQRGGLPMPQVYVIPQASPNAFATGRNPEHAAVAATEGILRILTSEELEGVIAHELAHVKHRDILISSIAATIAAAIMMVVALRDVLRRRPRRRPRRRQSDRAARDDDPRADRGDADSGGHLALARVRRRRRRRGHRRQPARPGERAAEDRGGVARASRSTPTRPRRTCSSSSRSRARGLLSLFSTHPPTEQRVQALTAAAPAVAFDRGSSQAVSRPIRTSDCVTRVAVSHARRPYGRRRLACVLLSP